MQVNPIRNNITSGLTAAQASQVQRAQESKQPAHDKPVEAAEQSSRFYQAPDEYSRQEPEEASGRYWLEPSEDGPQLRYSAPEEEEPKASSVPENEPEKEVSNVTTTNTDDVDREIERLRKKAEDLEAQADKAEGPEAEKLERQLRQARAELQRKDNDSYRRSHAKVS